MTSAAQPDPVDALTADAELTTDTAADEAAEVGPDYTGDMPDDPDEAVHYRPDVDAPGGSMDEERA